MQLSTKFFALHRGKEHTMLFHDRSFDPMHSLTLADAAKVTGLKPRTLQFWTMNDVVLCDPETRHGGPGVRRTYDPREIAIAALLGKLSNISIPIGELRNISEMIREIYRYGDVKNYKEAAEQLNLAMKKSEDLGEEAVELRIKKNLGEISEYPENIKDTIKKIDNNFEMSADCEAFYAALEGSKEYEGISFVAKNTDNCGWSVGFQGYITYSGNEDIDLKTPRSWAFVFVVNASEVFRGIHS